MPEIRIKELRDHLKRSKASWSVHPRLADNAILPVYSTGASRDGLVPIEQARPVELKRIVARINNPMLIERHIARGLRPETDRIAPISQFESGKPVAPEAGANPTKVDWRNRWGWPWLTQAKDQGGCNSCWAFGAVALVESMTRIEHCVWSERSEGDVHRGMGATCPQLGNVKAALDWIHDHGVADPGCVPYVAGNGPYTPTADRNGRAVRIEDENCIHALGPIADQKAWLDAVGPIATWFEVWNDFFGYGTGVYRKSTIASNAAVGGHIMLIVGYDDTQNCWIVRNSWGSDWGESGYGKIAYGECGIDTYIKYGVQGTNPDPWTKRRLHNGNIYESGWGSLHRNFELVQQDGMTVRHMWRDDNGAQLAWGRSGPIATDAASPATFIETTFDRHYELVYQTTSGRLHHWWNPAPGGAWVDGGVFGPPDAAGTPACIQANYGAPGNFEVVVRTADGRLAHWWRDGAWHEGPRFASNVACMGSSLVQSHFGTQGNFDLVCTLADGRMQQWTRNNDAGQTWTAGATFGSGITSSPVMIEGSYGAANEHAPGNFELCVAARGSVQHWWRNNGGDKAWRQSATFGSNVRQVVGLLQGSYGFNLEVIVERFDNRLQHCWRDGAGWHEGAIL